MGTGFIFLESGPGADLFTPYLVTSRHVVEGFDHFSFFFAAGDPGAVVASSDPQYRTPFSRKPLPGKKIDVEIKDCGDLWHAHPDPRIDLAVLPLMEILTHAVAEAEPVFIHPIADVHIPNFMDPMFDSVEEILFVGYPTGLIDEKNFTPITRRGITATPLDLDFGGEPKFLIDASVFPGSSGSPVFLFNSCPVYTPSGIVVTNRYYLLGLVASSFYCNENGIIPTPIDPSAATRDILRQMIDIGSVIKAHCIKEAVLDGKSKRSASAPYRMPSGTDVGDRSFPVSLQEPPVHMPDMIKEIPADETDRDEIWDEILRNLGVGPDGGQNNL